MLVIWSLPTVLHLTLRRAAPAALRLNGLTAAGWWWTGWGVVLGLIGFLLGHLAAMNVPPAALTSPGVAAGVVGLGTLANVAAAAAGEEFFFRGFLQGQLAARWGDRVALWGQAAAFLLPHLPLLLVDAALWPLLPVQFILGLLLGVLRRRSGSVWPAVVAHVLTNVMAGIFFG